jgi:hypothetical protein
MCYPQDCVQPFPGLLSIGGVTEVDPEISETGFAWPVTLAGYQNGIVPAYPDVVEAGIAFTGYIPARPDACGTWIVSRFDKTDLESVVLECTAGPPEWIGVTATLAITQATAEDCHNANAGCSLEGVWGWRLDATDMKGRPIFLVFENVGMPLHWLNVLTGMELVADNAPEAFARSCKLKLQNGCTRLGTPLGFCIPADADICGEQPISGSCSWCSDIQMLPVQRIEALSCGWLPGTPLTLTAICDELPTLPVSSACDPDHWRVYLCTDWVDVPKTTEHDPWTWYFKDGNDIEYGIARITPDDEHGEAVFEFGMAIPDAA